VDNIHSYANYYQNFKFSDGDILLDYAICSPINGTDFEFAVAPLVASAKNFHNDSIPAFVFSWNVTSQCELEQNWYQPIQQGSSVNIDFSGFIKQAYNNLKLTSTAPNILIEWQYVDTSSQTRIAYLILFSVCGAHIIFYSVVVFYILGVCDYLKFEICPKGKHVRYEDI